MKKFTLLLVLACGIAISYGQYKSKAKMEISKGATIEADSLALVKLYYETNGKDWYNNENWLTGAVSSWYGITVKDGRVTAINLRSNNLYGEIPQDIGNLTQLDTLDLRDNYLNGIIPDEIGNLSKLLLLDLGWNRLSGNIPASLGNLTQLIDLYLDGNLLTSIPSEIDSLTQLKYLYLADNALTGAIPEVIGNLTMLESLTLGQNNFTGSVPNAFTHLTNLQYLDVQSNSLDELPDLSTLTNLNTLYASYNRFTFEDIEPNITIADFDYSPQAKVGEVKVYQPSDGSSVSFEVSVGGTANSYQWYKDDNPIPGATNSSFTIASYSGSSDAGVYFCKITNSIATSLELVSSEFYVGVQPTVYNISVEILPTGGGTVSGTGDYYKGQTCTLTAQPSPGFVFDYWVSKDIIVEDQPFITIQEVTKPIKYQAYFRFTGTVNQSDSIALVALYNATDGPNWDIPWNLTKPVAKWEGVKLNANGRVYALDLESNNLAGNFPAEMGNLTELQYLNLYYNSLTGTLPSEIGNLNALTYLNFGFNKLTGIPDEIGNLNQLINLNLSMNKIEGNIPKSLANLQNLKTLNLSSNKFSGEIPIEITNLVSLETLKIYGNQLLGNIPDEIGNMSELTYLELSSNMLSGALPSSLGNLPKLESLFLDNNQLTGDIPTEIGNIPTLTYLYLSNNHLQGDVPNSLATHSKLKQLLIKNNKLSGLPDFTSSSVRQLYVQNNQFTFEDIEPNLGIYSFIYWPQDTVGQVQEINPTEGEMVNLEIVVGGTNNNYQWFKDGNPIAGATANTYTIASYNSSVDAGVYYCKITNTAAIKLTLYSYNYYVGVQAPMFDIAVAVNPAEGGTVEGAGTLKHGSTCALTATPAEGYNFTGWYESDNLIYTESPFSFLVTHARNIEARFGLKTYDVQVTANPTEGGTVTGAGNYIHGSTCTLEATPATGYNFDGWYQGSTLLSAETTYSFTVTQALTLEARFSLKTYTITVTITPTEGGTVTGAGSYNHGSTCTLEATPASGYRFVGWYKADTELSGEPTYSFTVTESHSIEARFNNSTSIADTFDDGYCAFPNPTNGVIKLLVPGVKGMLMIQLFSATGQLVASRKVTADNLITLNLEDYPTGIYSIILCDSTGTIKYFKVIKQ